MLHQICCAHHHEPYEWNEEQVQWDCIINIPYPDDGQLYQWNEDTLSWELITNNT